MRSWWLSSVSIVGSVNDRRLVITKLRENQYRRTNKNLRSAIARQYNLCDGQKYRNYWLRTPKNSIRSRNAGRWMARRGKKMKEIDEEKACLNPRTVLNIIAGFGRSGCECAYYYLRNRSKWFKVRIWSISHVTLRLPRERSEIQPIFIGFNGSRICHSNCF